LTNFSAARGSAILRKNGWKLLLIMLFLISMIIRFHLADFPKKLQTYPDDLRYLSIAENIATGRGISLFNGETDFQKILYSLFLIPAFFFSDKMVQIKMIALINAAWVSSGVFPVWFLGKHLLKDRKYAALLCVIYVFSADLAYSMTFLSEVTFLPLGLWCVCGFYILIAGIDKALYRYGLCALLGVLTYLLYLNKEIALVFLLAYLMVAFIQTMEWDAVNRRCRISAEWKVYLSNAALVVLVFGLLFLLFKLTLFAGLGNSYNQSSMDVLFAPGRVRYMLYGFVYYLCNALIAFGVFPVVFPAFCLRDMRKEERYFYLFLLGLLAASAAVVAYTITVREDFPLEVPRAHMRYITYLFLPFIAVMFKGARHTAGHSAGQVLLPLSAVAGLSLFLMKFYRGGFDLSGVDNTTLKYLSNCTEEQVVQYLVYACIFLFVGLVLLFKKRRLFVAFVSIVLIGTQLHNGALAVSELEDRYRVSDEDCLEIQLLDEYLKQYEEKTLVLVSDGLDEQQRIFDTYFNNPNIFTIDISYLLALQTGEGLVWADQPIPSMHGLGGVYHLDEVDVLIMPSGCRVEGETPVYKNSAAAKQLKYELYELKNPRMLPPVREWWTINTGINTFEVDSEHFHSQYEIQNGRFVSGGTPCYLLYGPYKTLPAGEYTVSVQYRYSGDLPEGSVLGTVDLCGSILDPAVYCNSVIAGRGETAIEHVLIPGDCQRTEIRLYATAAGVEITGVTIIKH